MLTSISKITYRNGYRLNGQPVSIHDIEPIFEGRRAAAISIWEQYERSKVALRTLTLTQRQYQDACRQIAESLGV